MVSLKFFAAAALAGLAVAAPTAEKAEVEARAFTDPAELTNPTAQTVLKIETEADGLTPNGAPPPSLAADSITTFQLIAFNEIFEVAFFESLLYNITQKVHGYEYGNSHEMIEIIQTVLAQEELHALVAIQTLEHFHAFAPSPCQYTFGVDNLYDAIALAETFTSVVLGTLQDAIYTFAGNQEAGPARSVSSVIGNEGEQQGYYRYILSRKPSAQPFLTTSVGPFAWSALQGFVVPGSCPFPLSNIDIPIFEPIQVQNGGTLESKTQTVSFTVDLGHVADAESYIGGRGDGLFMTYLNGQTVPFAEPISNVRWSGSAITFDALFPFEDYLMWGLTLGALTTQSNIAAPDDVPSYTLAAPAIIMVNDLLQFDKKLVD